MQITLSTLSGKSITLDVSQETNVQELKQIASHQLNTDSELLQLAFKGKKLQNDEIIGNTTLQEGDKLIVMIQKAKPEARPPIADPLQLEREEKIKQLMEMGFDREQVIVCLNAAEYNTEIAVDYLFNGISEHHNLQTISDNNPLKYLINNSVFHQIRPLIRQNPQALPQLLSQLQNTNPQLCQQILDNQEAFMELINAQLPDNIQLEDQNSEQFFPNTKIQTVEVGPRQMREIKSLIDMGYSQKDALEAFVICDRNQIYAANYLVSNYQTLQEQGLPPETLKFEFDDDQFEGEEAFEQIQLSQQDDIVDSMIQAFQNAGGEFPNDQYEEDLYGCQNQEDNYEEDLYGDSSVQQDPQEEQSQQENQLEGTQPSQDNQEFPNNESDV